MSHRPFSFVARPSAHQQGRGGRAAARPAGGSSADSMEARTAVADTLKAARAALREDGEFRPRPPPSRKSPPPAEPQPKQQQQARRRRAPPRAAAAPAAAGPTPPGEGGASLLHPTRPQTPAPSRSRGAALSVAEGSSAPSGGPAGAASPRARLHAYSPLTQRPQTARRRPRSPPPKGPSPPPRQAPPRQQQQQQPPPQQQPYARPTSARGRRREDDVEAPAAPAPMARPSTAAPGGRGAVSLLDAIERTERMASHERASARDVLALCGHLFQQRPRSSEELYRLCRLVMRAPFSAEFAEVRTRCYRGLFRLSKDAANDGRLLTCADDIVASLETLPGLPLQAFSYLLSAVKNLSVSTEGQRALVDFGGVRALAALLDEGVYAEPGGGGGAPAGGRGAGGRVTEAARDVRARLFSEVAVVLRNLATLETEHDFVADAGVVGRLCGLMERYPESGELMLSVCRVLSKVSGHETCREQLLAHPTGLPSLVGLLPRHERSVALTVRASYVLGNLTVTCEEARVRIARECDGVNVLLGALQHCVAEEAVVQNALERCVFAGGAVSDDEDELSDDDSGGGSNDKGAAGEGGAAADGSYTELRRREAEVVDAMVKLVRVVANVATHPEAGPLLATDRRASLLVPLLSRAGSDSDELALNAVSAVANLTYYGCGDPAGHVLFEWAAPLLGGLSRAVFAASPEMLVEAARALSNLSVDVQFRSHMRQHHITEALVILLDHGDDGVVFAVCGALMNLATDPELSDVFMRNECAAVGKLADCLERAMGWDMDDGSGAGAEGGALAAGGAASWSLCDVVLKVLANLRIGTFTAGGPSGSEWVPHPPAARRLESLLLRLSEHFDDAAQECSELESAHRYDDVEGAAEEYGATGDTLQELAELCHDLLAAMATGGPSSGARRDAGC